MQDKGIYRKKQAAMKSVFGPKRNESVINISPVQAEPHYKIPCSLPIDIPGRQENFCVIENVKVINSLLTVAFCGMRRPGSNRTWSFCQGTPSCRMEKLFAKLDVGTTHDRFLLVPDFFTDNLGMEFTSFLDTVEGVSEKFKDLFEEGGYDVSNWKSSVRSNNGALQGLQVKARQRILAERLYALPGKSIQAIVKLSCAFFTPERSGLSFEIIDIFCRDGEPTQEWCPTPLDMDENCPPTQPLPEEKMDATTM